MTTAIDLCNRALMRLGTQSAITSLNDGSVEASVCAAFYDDVLEGLLAHPASMSTTVYTWQWPRCVGTGATVASDNPRWNGEITLPSDCVRVLRVDDARSTAQPNKSQKLFMKSADFGEGMGKAGGSVLVPVILTDLQNVSVTYITKSVDIDYWPPTFRRAFWLSLASAIATTLGIDGSTTAAVTQEAEREVARACMADQRVEAVSAEVTPDWLAARYASIDWDINRSCHMANEEDASLESGYIAGGSQPASSAVVSPTLPPGQNGVVSTGLTARDIGDNANLYVPADTPDGRVGILTIGRSPAGWRRPYHGEISDGLQDGTAEQEK